MKVLSVVVVFATLLALVVTWPNDNPDYELSLQQLENAVIKANGELSFNLHNDSHPIRLRSPYQCFIFTKYHIILSLMT